MTGPFLTLAKQTGLAVAGSFAATWVVANVAMPSAGMAEKLGRIGGPNLVVVIFVLFFCFFLVYAVFKSMVTWRNESEGRLAAIPAKLQESLTSALQADRRALHADREENRKLVRELCETQRVDYDRNFAEIKAVTAQMMELVRESIRAESRLEQAYREIAPKVVEMEREIALIKTGYSTPGEADPAPS